ncbi:hypothetical protein [Plasmodium yoelii yoelii]|jgi:hypothetical protein
MILNI